MIETAGGLIPFLCHVFLILFGGFFGLSFAFNKNFDSFILGYNLLYSKNNYEYQHILYLELLISDKVKLRLSNTDYLRDLFIEFLRLSADLNESEE